MVWGILFFFWKSYPISGFELEGGGNYYYGLLSNTFNGSSTRSKENKDIKSVLLDMNSVQRHHSSIACLPFVLTQEFPNIRSRIIPQTRSIDVKLEVETMMITIISPACIVTTKLQLLNVYS